LETTCPIEVLKVKPQAEAESASPMPVRNILWDIALNATIPLLLYKVSKRYISHSELHALLIATTFPLVKNVVGLMRHRQLDPVSILVLLGIVTSCIALLLGGDPRILLVRESLFSGVLGVACIASLLLRRPMMFYFGRYFMAGNDSVKQEKFDATWQWPDVRFAHRLITTVWGIVYTGEFVVRVLLIYTLPVTYVLAISPVLMGTLTICTVLWTFGYVRRLRKRHGFGAGAAPLP
jgi:hypothetical protein